MVKKMKNNPEAMVRHGNVFRMVLPFSYINYFLRNPPECINGASNIKTFENENRVSLDKCRFKYFSMMNCRIRRSPNWRPLSPGVLEDLKGVFIPQVVNLMSEREVVNEGGAGEADRVRHFPDIAIYDLDPGVRSEIFGSGMLMAPRKKYSKGARPDGAHGCLIGGVRLVLCASGVGLLLLDLHYAGTLRLGERGGVGGKAGDKFVFAPEEFVSTCQYVPKGGRKGMDPVFHLNPDVMSLALKDPMFGPIRSRTEAGFRSWLINRLADEFKGAEQGESAEHSGFKREVGQNFNLLKEILFPALEKLEAFGRSKLEDGALPDGIADYVGRRRQELLNDFKRHANQEMSAWSYADLMAFVFSELQIELRRAMAMDSFFVNGDRMFVFSHLNISDTGPSNGNDERFSLAMKLCRRHDDKHGMSGDCGVVRFNTFDTMHYFVSLEGMCVLQFQGQNKDFSVNTAIVRERQFYLAMLALLYRASFQTFRMMGASISEEYLDDELALVENIAKRIDLYIHDLYFTQISNFTHIQYMFDRLMEAFRINELWSEVELNVNQYMEKRKQLLDNVQAERRKKFQWFATGFASLLAVEGGLGLLEHLRWRKGLLDLLGTWGKVALLVFVAASVCLLVKKYIFRPSKHRGLD